MLWKLCSLEPRQLVPIIGTRTCLLVLALCIYRKQHRDKLGAATYFKQNGTWQAHKCAVEMPVQYVHCDWNALLSHQRVEFISRSERDEARIKSQQSHKKTNMVMSCGCTTIKAKNTEGRNWFKTSPGVAGYCYKQKKIEKRLNSLSHGQVDVNVCQSGW